MHAPRTPIEPGSVWRNASLGSVAVYEVVRVDGDHVDVEVRRAPGLPAGTRVRLTRAALTAMQRLPREEVQRRQRGCGQPQAMEGPEPAGG